MADPKLTDLELRVLRDCAEGRDPWRGFANRVGSRLVSQALGRLERKGALEKSDGTTTHPRGVLTEAGRRLAMQKGGDRG